MNVENDVIFVITHSPSYSFTVTGILAGAIAEEGRIQHCKKQQSVDVAALTTSVMKEALWNPAAVDVLPPQLINVRRKLLVGFDTEANDFLDKISREIGRSEEATKKAEADKMAVFSVGALVSGFCECNGWNKVWIQKPLHSSIDGKLTQRLANRGLEIYQLDEGVEKLADARARSAVACAAAGRDDEAAATAREYWHTLQYIFDRDGVQVVLLDNGMTILEKWRDESMTTPEILDINRLYLSAIVTWALGDY